MVRVVCLVVLMQAAGCMCGPAQGSAPQEDAPFWTLLFPDVEAARRAQACTDAHDISMTIDQFRLTQRRCPESMAELTDYGLVRKVRKDPWGGDFQFTCNPSQEARVRSRGPDKQIGNDDDVILGQGNCDK